MSRVTRSIRVLDVAIRLLPGNRHDLAAAMLAEIANIDSVATQRHWIRSTAWFIAKEGIVTWLRLLAIGSSAVFILWILFNAMDSGWVGTWPQIASATAMIGLLSLNIVLLGRELPRSRRRSADHRRIR